MKFLPPGGSQSSIYSRACAGHPQQQARSPPNWPPPWGAAGLHHKQEGSSCESDGAACQPLGHSRTQVALFPRTQKERLLGPHVRPSAGFTPASPPRLKPRGARPSQSAGALRSRFLSQRGAEQPSRRSPGGKESAPGRHQAPQAPAAPDVFRRKRLQPTEVVSARCDGRENSGALVAREAPLSAGRSSLSGAT